MPRLEQRDRRGLDVCFISRGSEALHLRDGYELIFPGYNRQTGVENKISKLLLKGTSSPMTSRSMLPQEDLSLSVIFIQKAKKNPVGMQAFRKEKGQFIQPVLKRGIGSSFGAYSRQVLQVPEALCTSHSCTEAKGMPQEPYCVIPGQNKESKTSIY